MGEQPGVHNLNLNSRTNTIVPKNQTKYIGDSVKSFTCPRINTLERSHLEKIDSLTLLLESCVMSSYFESTISDYSDASILHTLCTCIAFKILPRSCKRSRTLFKSLLFWLAGEVSWLAVEVLSPCQNKSKDFWNRVSLLLQDLGFCSLSLGCFLCLL